MATILRYDQLFIRQLPYLKNVIILSLKNSRENVAIRKEKRGISLSYNELERYSSAFFSCLMPFPGAFPFLLQHKTFPFTSRFMRKYILKEGVLQNWKWQVFTSHYVSCTYNFNHFSHICKQRIVNFSHAILTKDFIKIYDGCRFHSFCPLPSCSSETDTYYYGRGVKDETCSLININDAIFLSINFIIQIKNHTFATAISKRVP